MSASVGRHIHSWQPDILGTQVCGECGRRRWMTDGAWHYGKSSRAWKIARRPAVRWT